MAVREPDPHWNAVHKALINRIARRDADYLELHEDYLALQRDYNTLMGVICRQAKRDRAAIDERRRMDAANEAASG